MKFRVHSPDGRTAVVGRFDNENPGDLWSFELRRGAGTRVSFDPDPDTFPVWLPNGKSILFTRMKEDARGAQRGSGALMVMDITRSDPERVVRRATPNQYGPWVMDASNDGRYALLLMNEQDGSGDLGVLPRSRHRPVAVTDGSLTEKVNKNGVRFWPGPDLVDGALTPRRSI